MAAGVFDYLAADQVVNVVVGSAKGRRRDPGVVSHVWSLPVPDRAFGKLGRGLHLSSPEFTFLQMAQRLEFYDLIQLGYELCGTYALSAGDPRGFVSRRAPLTSADKIRAFLDKCPGAKGTKLARLAAGHIVNGSASPMESALAMILILPIRYGGYAFPAPEMNKELRLDLKADAAEARRTRLVRCDLLWPDARVPLAIEYDSDAEHLSSYKFSQDSIRRNDLVATDFVVITVTKHQLLNRAHWPVLVGQVSRILGVKPRIRSKGFHEAQRLLYASLFSRFFASRGD